MNTWVDNFNIKAIDILNKVNNVPLNLGNGKMGLCIYYYYISRKENSALYKRTAEKLLNDVVENIQSIKSINITDGLAGIGMGISYLIKNKYISGSTNKILSDLDDEIFRKLTDTHFLQNIEISSLIQSLFYWTTRIKEQRKNSENEELFKGLVIDLINLLHFKLTKDSFDEKHLYYNFLSYELPQIHFILKRINDLDFYNYRISKIVEELLHQSYTRIPALNGSKLCLIWGLNETYKYQQSDSCKKHIEILKNELDINILLTKELRNKNIFLNDGCPSVFWLLVSLREYFSVNEFQNYLNLINTKIEKSEIWEEILEDDNQDYSTKLGLLNGFSGAIFTTYQIRDFKI